MSRDKVLSLLGLAAKSRKLVSGEFSVEQAVKQGKASLVIIAEDASDNTKKLFSDKCKYYHVPLFIYSDRETLGQCIGKEFRASIAIQDEGFAKGLKECLKDSQINTEVIK